MEVDGIEFMTRAKKWQQEAECTILYKECMLMQKSVL